MNWIWYVALKEDFLVLDTPHDHSANLLLWLVSLWCRVETWQRCVIIVVAGLWGHIFCCQAMSYEYSNSSYIGDNYLSWRGVYPFKKIKAENNQGEKPTSSSSPLNSSKSNSDSLTLELVISLCTSSFSGFWKIDKRCKSLQFSLTYR